MKIFVSPRWGFMRFNLQGSHRFRGGLRCVVPTALLICEYHALESFLKKAQEITFAEGNGTVVEKPPHGLGNAVILPTIMKAITPARIAEMAFIARSLNPSLRSKPDADAAGCAAVLVEELGAKVGIPKGLRALGVKQEQLPQISQMASTVRRLLDNSPVAFSESDLLRLLQEAF